MEIRSQVSIYRFLHFSSSTETETASTLSLSSFSSRTWSTPQGGTRPTCATWWTRAPPTAWPGATWRTSTPGCMPRRPSSYRYCLTTTPRSNTTSPGTKLCWPFTCYVHHLVTTLALQMLCPPPGNYAGPWYLAKMTLYMVCLPPGT